MISAIDGDHVQIDHVTKAGVPYPLGATVDGDGVNFALFSAHATGVDLCLFSADGSHETARVSMRARSGDIWHIHVGNLEVGALYGFRVHGAYDPSNGHRFNPNKLLMDPYAKQYFGSLIWSEEVLGYDQADEALDLSFDTRDSAPFVPKSAVVDAKLYEGTRPNVQDKDRIIYETHVKGFTQTMGDIEHAGTYAGLASDTSIEHLKNLGVTTIELLPVHGFISDGFLVERGLTNYWGYQTMGFFTPHSEYMATDDITEFQAMVTRLHKAGFEVIIDVVYNHTGESNELGPTLSFRGIDNASYYKLDADARYYTNYTGTGNMLDLTHPYVLQMVMDSLRYWVEVMGVDGFRFDLATILARGEDGFDKHSAFLHAIRQDPVLSQTVLIAEPWDIGPGGYQMGNWPYPFLEWNDRFRDDVRMYWRGDAGKVSSFSASLLGSAPHFDHSGRSAVASVNFVSAHDGFTLADTVKFVEKHNLANMENNKDGHGANYSDNFGVEGETDDAGIKQRRSKRIRAMMASLLLSQGTPMILAGDELGNSQGGNNNAYAQDNATAWLNWADADWDMFEFTRELIAIRKKYLSLGQREFLHSDIRNDGQKELTWYLPNGEEPEPNHWSDPNWRTLAVEVRVGVNALENAESAVALFIIFNPDVEQVVKLPDGDFRLVLDSATGKSNNSMHSDHVTCAEQSVQIFEKIQE